MLYLLNALLFGFLFTIWERSSTLNTALKFAFLLFTLANAAAFYHLGSQTGWTNLTGFRLV